MLLNDSVATLALVFDEHDWFKNESCSVCFKAARELLSPTQQLILKILFWYLHLTHKINKTCMNTTTQL
jgi:hypothetical protein